MILKTSIIGTEEMVRERLRAYRDAGVSTLRLSTGGDNWKARTDSLAQALDLIKSEAGSW
jgi:alkanesulfonate monooxygenase SsuD/methylene tetrahydromethanopterin reductase-like flavin-dependent oxidoreductase (luciferase family)